MDTYRVNGHSNASLSLSTGGIPFAFPGLPGIGCFFSSTDAGNMSLLTSGTVQEKEVTASNRKRLLGLLQIGRWVELRQIHTDTLLEDPAPTPLEQDSTLEADASCTAQKGVALAIKTADCQPILLTTVQGTAIAALHVGWRGNVINFPASGLHRFCERYGVTAKDVLAVRGPSLGPGASEFVNFEQEWSTDFLPWFDEQSRLMNLWDLTRHQLLVAGMRPEHIFSLDLCTYSLPDLFFSYRRGHTGRQVSLIWIRQ